MLAAFAAEIQAIDAEESLARVNVLQVGTGTAKRSRARTLIQRWQRLARRAQRRRMTEVEWHARIAASGIRLEVIGERH